MSETDQSPKLVYAKTATLKLGVDQTSRTAESETFYVAEQTLEDGSVRLNVLDMNNQPTGIIEVVDAEELAGEFKPVPDFYDRLLSPEQQQAAKFNAQGQHHLGRQEYNSAEFEFDQALKKDDRNIEAHIGKGESLLGQGDEEGARQVLARVTELEELYEKKNKHVLNAYGISMREKGFFKEAIKAYAKGLNLDPRDENLHFNLARTLYDLGDLKRAATSLQKALGLNPQHSESADLKRLIIRQLSAKKAAAGAGGPAWEISRAKPEDLARIRTLTTDYFKELGLKMDQQGLDADLAEPIAGYAGGGLLLARRQGETDGMVGLRILEPGVGELKRMYIKPEVRDKGLGGRLMDQAIALARQLGLKRLVLDTRLDLKAANQLYERYGFKDIEPYNQNPRAERFMGLELS